MTPRRLRHWAPDELALLATDRPAAIKLRMSRIRERQRHGTCIRSRVRPIAEEYSPEIIAIAGAGIARAGAHSDRKAA